MPTVGLARRLTSPSWLDARLVVGVLLVLVSVLVGARVVSSSNRLSPLYVAAHALVPGEHLVASDLSVGHVRLQGQGELYVSADEDPPVGYVVQRYVGAGELLPRAAIVSAAAAPADRLVTLPVAPGHLPPGLAAGDLVDVYLTRKTDGGDSATVPERVAANLAVEQAEDNGGELSGETTTTVVVSVPQADVTAVVRAVESGDVDIVLVPDAVAQGLGATPAGSPTPTSATSSPSPSPSRTVP